MLKIRVIFFLIVHFLFCSFLLSGFAYANSDDSLDSSVNKNVNDAHYSLEMHGGFFYFTDKNWPEYYGGKSTPEIGLSFSRRFFNVLDVGSSVSFSQTQGAAVLPVSQIQSGNVYHKIMPVELFAVLRARFSHKQWLVPYIGGGYTRLFYQQTLNNVTYSRGSINGLHARAGLQFLLDSLDVESAKTMRKTYGVINSYLFMEGKILKADIRASTGTSAVDLGGTSYRLGIMLEY